VIISLKIFWIFFKISLLSFGGIFGVLPALEHMLVTEQAWLTHEQFYQSYVMAQFLPGPNMAMCPLIGYWVDGWKGFLAGFLGIYTAPFLIMAFAYWFYNRYRELQSIKKAEMAIRPVIIGLILASCARLWWVQTTGGYFFQTIGVLLILVFIFLYLKKKVQAIGLIFYAGLSWLILTQLYLL